MSTLKALFQGRRERFRGVAIEKTDWEHEVYSMLHLDMSVVAARFVGEGVGICDAYSSCVPYDKKGNLQKEKVKESLPADFIRRW